MGRNRHADNRRRRVTNQPGSEPEIALTAFPIKVARLFFDLPASKGFLLAGGAALAALQLTARPTQHLDMFARPDHGSVTKARDAFEAAAQARGWTVQRIRDFASFARLMVSGTEELLVDLALDAPPNMPPTISVAGPTFAPIELAARKLIALFDRAEARDFVDVYVLSHRFAQDRLLALAAEVDTGFDHKVLAEMMRTHTRFADQDFPIDTGQISALRSFFDTWSEDLLR